jgi:hypothetical protein
MRERPLWFGIGWSISSATRSLERSAAAQNTPTENAALSARLTAVDIIARRLTAAVLLIRALGGDWNSAIGDPHTGAAAAVTSPAGTG